MSFVDRYWEWRRWRALEASLRASEHAREGALVADVLIMDRRGISRRPGDREQALPVGEATAAPAHPDGVPSKRRAKAQTHKTVLSPDRDAPGRPTILAAIDGTRSSAEVGRHAVRLAEGLGAKLFVLSFISVAPASRTGVYRRRALAELKRDSDDMAKQTKELAEKSGVECEVRRTLDPHPSRAIVAAAEEVGAYCVVIGSSGASVVDRLLDRALGGVHEKVLRRARCPVLSVR
jgi:nucleotide-binding universal stress UspA family protein